MNLKFFKSIFFLSAMLFSAGMYAQSDSVTVENQMIGNDAYYNLKYESLDLFLRDETHLFKIAVSPFKPNERYDFSIILSQLSYERKFNYAWSGIAELNQEFMLLKTQNIIINSFDLGGRNYFLKAKQISRGLSGNNCNGLYAGAKISGIITANHYLNAGTQNNFVGFRPIPELNTGIQQRISNLFFVDANAFVNYNFFTQTSGYGIKILIGLAINAGE